ncbi:MAG TPA: hypothetical protein VHI31_06810 [Actinomycetota bacterium]|nr:hypothetical protein [Actinomycetota bacterium]
MIGPRGAFSLTSIQLLAGIFAFMWFASLRYKMVKRGYYRSTTWVLWPLMLLLAFVLPGYLETLAFAAAGAYLLFLLAVYSQRPLLEWVTGALGSAVSLGLIAASGWEICEGGCTFGVVHALLGGLVLGSVTHGMILGHWYLNQARMPIEPLKEQTRLIFALLGLSAVAGIVTRAQLLKGPVPAGIMTYASSSYWWTWLFLLTTTAALMGMVRATVRDRSTQSATGLLYIASLTALAAQFILDLLVTT